jgi:hypothetical protein
MGFRHTPMFPLESFGEKYPKKTGKKVLQNICLNSWIASINILINIVLIRVYIIFIIISCFFR